MTVFDAADNVISNRIDLELRRVAFCPSISPDCADGHFRCRPIVSVFPDEAGLQAMWAVTGNNAKQCKQNKTDLICKNLPKRYIV